MKNALSVVLATYNEENNLAACLESVKNLGDELIVVDGGSKDKTVEISKKYHARVIQTDNPAIFHINKQKAVDLATKDWVLQLDADERVTSQLAGEIKQTISLPGACDGYYLKRKNFFLGRWLSKGGQYPDPLIRLFKKGKGSFPCKSVHEQIEINGEVGTLNNDLLHYTAPTFSRYLTNSDRYTSLTAKKYGEEKIGINPFSVVNYLLVKPFLTFFSLYFRHRGYVDGFPGFIFAYFSGLHHAIAYIKYWKSQATISINN